MKKFLSVVVRLKTAACVIFTAYLCIILAVGFACGLEAISLSYLLSMLLAAVLFAVLQWLCLSTDVFRSMRYSRRILLFAALGLAGLTGLNLLFHWMPVEQPLAWAIFLAVFFAILALVTLQFEFLFKLQGKKYDGLLGEYRKKNAK